MGAASAPLGWRPKVPLRVRLVRRPVRCWTTAGQRAEGRGALGGRALRAKRGLITRACGYASALAGRSAQLVWASADIGRRRGSVNRAASARATRPGRRRNWRQLSGCLGIAIVAQTRLPRLVRSAPLARASCWISHMPRRSSALSVGGSMLGRQRSRRGSRRACGSHPGCPWPDGELPPDAVSSRATLLVAVCVDAKGG